MRPLIATCLIAALASTAISQQAASAKITDLGWLAGCWEMNNEKRGILITEMWMKPGGDVMMGIGRTAKAGKAIDFEFLRIVEDANGLSYVSRPSGNKEDTAFKMIRIAADEVVFENAAHDFPQRVMYMRDGEKMTARIEGITNGKMRRVDFDYRRVRCD
jgi:hypothetical protein